MATKVVHTVREDKQGLQKQLGCMNRFFHLLDRSYLLGLHRHWRNQNRLTQGHGEKGLKKSSEKTKEKNQKKTTVEKNRTSVESSRNSCSSSCSSTTFSSFDCSKRVQTEWQVPSEPTSPSMHKKQPPPDIRDVVKESMTRVIRVKNNERAGNVMKHVDSPRPFIQQSCIQYERKDQNLAKIQKIASAVKEVKGISRYSCDERESQYSLKSSFKVKELPRLSLDSNQNSKTNSKSESRSESGSNKRPSSGIVARLMGLDGLTDSICEVETLKIKSAFGNQLGSCSPRVNLKIQTALQQQEGGDRCPKRLSALEFKTSGKDLRARKHTVEAVQMTKKVFENKEQSLDSRNNDQPDSPTVKGTRSPKKLELLNRAVKPSQLATEPVTVTGLNYANHKARKQVKDPTPRNNKATSGTTISPDDQTGERSMLSPRLQMTKNGIEKQCFNGPSSDSSRIKKQSNSKTRHSTTKPINPMQNNDQSCMYSKETRSLNQGADTFNSHKLDSKQEDTPNNFGERLIEDKPMMELAKLTMEQASPVSVLDAFYVEDMPSPVKTKPNAFNVYDNLHIDETEWNHGGIYNLATCTDVGQFHQIELLNSADGEIAKSPRKSTNEDHNYIRKILLASGFLKDPDYAIRIAQLHSTGVLIKPELFHILENPRSKSNEKARRKLIFDSVNDIVFHKLAMNSLSGKSCGRFVDGEKLLTDVWLEIDSLQTSSERCIHDEDDEVKILVSTDVNKNSQDWNTYCCEVPGLVLDIERLIFKDLVDEIVNVDARGVQDRLGGRCRRLFSM